MTAFRGDFAVVAQEHDNGIGKFVRRLSTLYEDDSNGQKFAHVQWFDRSSETLLGDAADPRELFQVLFCNNVPLSAICGKSEVVFWPVPNFEEWAAEGGTEKASIMEPPFPKDGQDAHMFYRMRSGQKSFDSLISWYYTVPSVLLTIFVDLTKNPVALSTPFPWTFWGRMVTAAWTSARFA